MHMKIYVKAKPNSKQIKVEKISDNQFSVWVKELAQNGKANEAILQALADYFGVSASLVRIVNGRYSKQKIVEIVANEK